MSQERKVTINTVNETEETAEEDILDAEDRIAVYSDEDVDNQNQDIEDIEDEVPLWENGPLAGTVKEWKRLYGDVYITSISFDKHIVWRTLSRVEYKQIVKKMENLIQSGEMSSAEANMWNEETIAELCILFPEMNANSMSSVLAGLPSLIAQEVLEASGFVALEVRQL